MYGYIVFKRAHSAGTLYLNMHIVKGKILFFLCEFICDYLNQLAVTPVSVIKATKIYYDHHTNASRYALVKFGNSRHHTRTKTVDREFGLVHYQAFYSMAKKLQVHPLALYITSM